MLSIQNVYSILVYLCAVSVNEITNITENIMLAPYLNLCYRDDPKVGVCLRREIQRLAPLFKEGSKEFDLEPLDPLEFRDLIYNIKGFLLGGRMLVSHAYISGLTTLKVLDVRPNLSNPKKLSVTVDAFLPRMNIKASYKMDGHLLASSVNMNGFIDFDLENLNVRYHVNADIESIEGVKYLMLKSLIWRFRGDGIGNFRLRSDKVVEGRPALNSILKTLIKSSWRQLKNTLLPSILPEADRSLTRSFTKFFKKYPYDVIFPQRPRTYYYIF